MAVFSRHGFTEASGEDTSEKSAPRPRSSPHPGSPSTCASAGPYRPHYSYPSATRLESYVIWAASVGKAPKSKETCIVGAISRGASRFPRVLLDKGANFVPRVSSVFVAVVFHQFIRERRLGTPSPGERILGRLGTGCLQCRFPQSVFAAACRP